MQVLPSFMKHTLDFVALKMKFYVVFLKRTDDLRRNFVLKCKNEAFSKCNSTLHKASFLYASENCVKTLFQVP